MKKIKESISNILDIGGSIGFDYKGGMRDWYSKVEIHRLYDSYDEEHYNGYIYILQGVPSCYKFKDKNEAIDKIVSHVFNEKNLALILERLRLKLNIESFEDEGHDFKRPSKEFLKMISDEQQLYKEENK